MEIYVDDACMHIFMYIPKCIPNGYIYRVGGERKGERERER